MRIDTDPTKNNLNNHKGNIIMKKILTLLAFTCLGIAIAQEAPAPAPAAPPPPQANQQLPPPPNGKPGQPGNRPNHANMREQMLERQRKRLETSAKEIIEAYDTNKDGKLDEAEKAAMKAEFAKVEKITRLARDYRIIERLDANGDMVLTPEEFEKLPQAFNRDGMRPPMGGPRPPRDGNRPPRQPRPPRKPGEVKNADAPAPAQN